MYTSVRLIAKFPFGFSFNHFHFSSRIIPRSTHSCAVKRLTSSAQVQITASGCSTKSVVLLPASCQSFHTTPACDAGKMGDGRVSNTILLFDVDGTLTEHRQLIKPDMYEFLLNEVKSKVPVGLVGGSDLAKILEQMGDQSVLSKLDFVFSENGLVAHKNGTLLATQSIQEHMGEAKLQKFINFALGYMSKLELPVKRGTFIEFRKGMINICPVGRSCSQEERNQFDAYDKTHKVREKFVEALKAEFPDMGLKFAIGGQISIDVFPTGWDKTFCLRYLSDYQVIHFFGDRIRPGENDHEIYEHESTVGHYVVDPEDTMKQVRQVLQQLK